MEIKRDKVQELLDARGWTNSIFARKLRLNYSYIFRVMKGEREIGAKFFSRFLVLCEKEGLNFRDYISFDDNA